MPKITILKSLGNSDKSQKGQGCKKIGTKEGLTSIGRFREK